MTCFVDNRDNPRLTSRMPDGTPAADVLARFRLALGAMFTLPGIPQLMWGDELALTGGADPDNRRDMPGWAWTAATRAGAHDGALGDGQAQYAYVQRLIALRAAHPALQIGTYSELWRQRGGAANVLAFVRRTDRERIVVAINVGAAASVALPIGLPDGTVLTELLAAGEPATATVAGGTLSLALPAQSIGVYAARLPRALSSRATP